MALAKERAMRNPQQGLLQTRGGSSFQGFDPSNLEVLGFKGHHTLMLEDGYPKGHLPALSDMSNSTSSNSLAFGAVSSHLPVVNFKAGADHWAYSSSSVLSFEHEEESASWMDGLDQDYRLSQLNLKCGTNARLTKDGSCFEMASNSMKDNPNGDEQFGVLYSDLAAVDGVQEDGGQESGTQKRPYSGDDMQATKKQCGNGRKTKAKLTASKDPQSIAAKNRRERISERLKVLQELVPNGTKVDLVTMLEKAISYVKFLQLQVKVLATDEFWPAQGGKAPEVAQVKEVIDAILASHRDRSSSSKQ